MKFLTLTGWIGAVALFCQATPANARALFEWGHYDSALYVYSKHPEKLPVFEDALRAAIEKGRASKRLAPGLQAELAYCLMSEGKKEEAVELFKAEIASFPESRDFLTRFVTSTGGN